MIVVSKADSFCNVICQNPKFASSLEDTFASPIRTWMCYTDGMGCRSLRTLSFNLVRSTQMRILQIGIGTTIIAVHHSVSMSTFDITTDFSIRSSSMLVFSKRRRAILLGVVIVNGLALSLRWIVYSLGKDPKPSQNSGNLAGISNAMLLIVDTSSISESPISALCKS